MKLLSDWNWNKGKEYRAVLRGNATVELGMGYCGIHEFCSEDSVLRGILKDDKLTIFDGYASDLCSPGFYMFGKWHGTYSKGAEIPAFIHDFTRQFMRPNLPCSPWDMKATDVMFYNALTMVKFPLRSVYHGAVAGVLGNIWSSLNCSRPMVYCRCHENKII